MKEHSSPCNICLETTCTKEGSCNCKKCNHISECNRFLHASIRITNKCTQSCRHCCFCSSPKSEIMMSVAQAKDTSIFLENNNVKSIQVLGGEFFCNPDWSEILEMFLKVVASIRLVTNGDWAVVSNVKTSLIRLNKEYPGVLKVSVSKDKWHTNSNVDLAEEFLSANGFEYNIGECENNDEDSIVPVGNASFGTSYYACFSCYCKNPKYHYAFLIDEEGKIYKCSFGVCNYANIKDYLDGGFSKRFRTFNLAFNSQFISSCSACYRVFKRDNAVVRTD